MKSDSTYFWRDISCTPKKVNKACRLHKLKFKKHVQIHLCRHYTLMPSGNYEQFSETHDHWTGCEKWTKSAEIPWFDYLLDWQLARLYGHDAVWNWSVRITWTEQLANFLFRISDPWESVCFRLLQRAETTSLKRPWNINRVQYSYSRLSNCSDLTFMQAAPSSNQRIPSTCFLSFSTLLLLCVHLDTKAPK